MGLLESKNVSKTYGSVKALDEVSLNVEKGSWVSIMGPSGSGKTTLLNLIEKEALEALERMGLKERAGHLPSQMSGGEQQRVCIARALINYPALILADEPSGNLDEANEVIVSELFQELHRQGHTIVMVTHDPEVGDLAESKLLLDHGQLRER